MAAKMLGKMPLKLPTLKEEKEDEFWGENCTSACSPHTNHMVKIPTQTVNPKCRTDTTLSPIAKHNAQAIPKLTHTDIAQKSNPTHSETQQMHTHTLLTQNLTSSPKTTLPAQNFDSSHPTNLPLNPIEPTYDRTPLGERFTQNTPHNPLTHHNTPKHTLEHFDTLSSPKRLSRSGQRYFPTQKRHLRCRVLRSRSL